MGFGKLLFSFFSAFAVLLLCGCAGTAPRYDGAGGKYVSVVDGLPVVYDFLDDNAYNRRRAMPAPFSDVRTVTIHNTAGYLSARGERDRLNKKRDNVSVSFHFAVDENEAVQLIPLDMHAWHAGDGDRGDGNLHSISIEICRSLCTGGDSKLYERAEANAVILAAHLLNIYNLPTSALRMHRDWSGKHCPHRILDRNGWDDFKRRVDAARRMSSAAR